jgi:hypothetical protein
MAPEAIDYPVETEKLTTAAKILVQDQSGRARVEDFLSCLAAITGEFVLRTTPGFVNERPDIVPGRMLRSSTVMHVLSNGETDWSRIKPESAFGAMRHVLHGSDAAYWPVAIFPDITAVYRLAAAHRPTEESWGWVPVSVPPENRPSYQPLKAAYNLRKIVERSATMASAAPVARVSVGTLSLIRALLMTRGTIEPSVALALVYETMAGMAQTMPMSPGRMAEIITR